jgi:TRAP-type C4-dicarboxylate transport system permease small subunit
MKALTFLDNFLYKIIYFFCGFSVVAMLGITCAQVFFRYFLRTSIGSISDFPVYLMIYAVWLGAIVAAKRDDHIKIQLLDLIIKNEKILESIQIIFHTITAVAMCFFWKSSWNYVVHAFKFGSVNQASGLQWWIYYMILPFSTAFIILYNIVNVIKRIREVFLCH